MSNRERWILYPLLFFALLLGAKATFDRLTQAEFQRIECSALRVNSLHGPARVLLGESLDGMGEITLYNATGEPAVFISVGPNGKLRLTDLAGEKVELE